MNVDIFLVGSQILEHATNSSNIVNRKLIRNKDFVVSVESTSMRLRPTPEKWEKSSLRAEVRMHLQTCSLSYNRFLRHYCMHLICALRVPLEPKVLGPKALSPLHCVAL